MSGQPGGYQRSARGMVGAMIVVVGVVIAFVVLRDLNRTQPDVGPRAVEYQQTVDLARQGAGFDVLVPEPLPEGWTVTSVEFVPEPVKWHLGQLTAEGRYVGLEQARSPAETMVETYVDPEATRDGTVTVDGQSWTVWVDAGGDTALVRSEDDVTTLVVGTVGREALADYVSTLR